MLSFHANQFFVFLGNCQALAVKTAEISNEFLEIFHIDNPTETLFTMDTSPEIYKSRFLTVQCLDEAGSIVWLTGLSDELDFYLTEHLMFSLPKRKTLLIDMTTKNVTSGPELPETMFGFCSVLLNRTSVLFIGGYRHLVSTLPSNETSIYSLDTHEWSSGPRLNYNTSSESSSCLSLSVKDSKGSEIVLAMSLSIVFKDKSGSPIVEMWSPEWSGWKVLPEMDWNCWTISKVRLFSLAFRRDHLPYDCYASVSGCNETMDAIFGFNFTTLIWTLITQMKASAANLHGIFEVPALPRHLNLSIHSSNVGYHTKKEDGMVYITIFACFDTDSI